MTWIALKMLTGCRGKALGLIVGVAFASLLIAQQSSIFCGVMLSTTSLIRDVCDAEIWVMDPSVERVGPFKPLKDSDLYRVRSVRGVDWAAPFYCGITRVAATAGEVSEAVLLGLDDISLVGAPRKMTMGSLEDLDRPNAVLIDQSGYGLLWPSEPLALGRYVTLNDRRRLVVVGICESSTNFRTLPVFYTKISRLPGILPFGTGLTSYVLANARAGSSADQLARRIEASTGLQAKTRCEFHQQSVQHIFYNTGIPVNFAITVALGFLVGVLVSGQTFYLVTLENLPLFGTLKATGATNAQIVRMILLQSLMVGGLGYGIGVGLAAQFGEAIAGHTRLMFYMPWEILVGTGLSVLAMMTIASLLSIRRVLVLEPGIVFRR